MEKVVSENLAGSAAQGLGNPVRVLVKPPTVAWGIGMSKRIRIVDDRVKVQDLLEATLNPLELPTKVQRMPDKWMMFGART